MKRFFVSVISFLVIASTVSLGVSVQSFAYDGYERQVFRTFGADRYETAILIADELKSQLEVDFFDCIVVASGKDYPDALSAGPLAIMQRAPVLLWSPERNETINTYIKNNLIEGGRLYLVGGPAVVGDDVTQGINCESKRLWSSDRYYTNLAVMQEENITGNVSVCSGKSFADALSAAATGTPILLVGDELMADQRELLQSKLSWIYQDGKPVNYYISGGLAVVGQSIVDELPYKCANSGTMERMDGVNRYDTAIKTANVFYGLQHQLNSSKWSIYFPNEFVMYFYFLFQFSVYFFLVINIYFIYNLIKNISVKFFYLCIFAKIFYKLITIFLRLCQPLLVLLRPDERLCILAIQQPSASGRGSKSCAGSPN